MNSCSHLPALRRMGFSIQPMEPREEEVVPEPSLCPYRGWWMAQVIEPYVDEYWKDAVYIWLSVDFDEDGELNLVEVGKESLNDPPSWYVYGLLEDVCVRDVLGLSNGAEALNWALREGLWVGQPFLVCVWNYRTVYYSYTRDWDVDWDWDVVKSVPVELNIDRLLLAMEHHPALVALRNAEEVEPLPGEVESVQEALESSEVAIPSELLLEAKSKCTGDAAQAVRELPRRDLIREPDGRATVQPCPEGHYLLRSQVLEALGDPDPYD